MIQVGLDGQRLTEHGEHNIGVALDYAEDSVRFQGGKGKAERYALTVYDTWRSDNDWYYDLVLHAGSIRSKHNTTDELGTNVRGRYNTAFGSASIELGRHFELSEKRKLFIEPQVQIQGTLVKGANFQATEAARGHQDSMKSLIGRAGLRFGQDLGDRSKPQNWYVKADVLHDFAGRRGMHLTSTDGRDEVSRHMKGKKTWYDVGAGFNYAIGKDSYLWSDAEYITGGYKNSWSANAGIRWKF